MASSPFNLTLGPSAPQQRHCTAGHPSTDLASSGTNWLATCGPQNGQGLRSVTSVAPWRVALPHRHEDPQQLAGNLRPNPETQDAGATTDTLRRQAGASLVPLR